MEVSLNMIESKKMSAHPYNLIGTNLVKSFQTVAAPNIINYIGIVVNKLAVLVT